MDEELKKLLEKAQANFNEQREKNDTLTKQIGDLNEKLKSVTEQMEKGDGGKSEELTKKLE